MSAQIHPGPSLLARRVGYGVAITVNLLLLYLVNVEPGWQRVPFLTARAADVIWLVNLSLLAGVVANLLYTALDPPAVRALGEALSTGVGLASLLLIWQVFPFAFGAGSVPWDLLARWVVGVGIFGCVVGILVAVGRFAKAVSGDGGASRRG